MDNALNLAAAGFEISLNLTVASAWKPWRAAHLESSSQRAGYVKTYTPDFTFATVQGAGHLVPTYKP